MCIENMINDVPQIDLYRFSLPDKDFKWCYSASALQKTLSELCIEKCIKKIWVSADNYISPLRIGDKYANYYLGPEILIQFDDLLINLLIFNESLFKLRYFEHIDISCTPSTFDYIRNGDEEYCDITDIFSLKYNNIPVRDIMITATESVGYYPDNFDYDSDSDEGEFPYKLSFIFTDNKVLSFLGGDGDDFIMDIAEG